jgi:histidinol-phosphatase (PHP family)
MIPNITENFHTHTYRCNHAEGDVEEYALAAGRAGIDTLGISDHTPLPDGWMGTVRMKMEELEDYIHKIETVRVPGVRLLKGMECDINPRYFSFYRDELLGRHGFDYLIGALHWYLHEGNWIYVGNVPSAAHLRSYSSLLREGMESGLFDFIAHPDHFASGRKRWDAEAESCTRDILETARDTGTVLEINGNGFRKAAVEGETGLRPPYPWRPFWDRAREYDIPVICNSDAHRPAEVNASIDSCRKLAEETGLRIVSLMPVPA